MAGGGRNCGRGRSRSRARPTGKGKGSKSNVPKGGEREAKFAILNNSNATKYMPYDQVLKQLLRKMKKDIKMQDVAVAIETKTPWDEDAEKPVRKTSAIVVRLNKKALTLNTGLLSMYGKIRKRTMTPV